MSPLNDFTTNSLYRTAGGYSGDTPREQTSSSSGQEEDFETAKEVENNELIIIPTSKKARYRAKRYALARKQKCISRFNSTLDYYKLSNNGVNNISKYELSTLEILCLSQGLKFIPKPRDATNTEILADFEQFVRTVRLRYMLCTSDHSTSDSSLHVSNSDYSPPCASTEVERYLTMAKRKLD